jgi:hypothetical protein
MPAIYFYEQWYDCLSNFSANAVEIDGIVYPTAEHAYHAAKCSDAEGKAAILAARSPKLVKVVSNETFAAARRKDWNDAKVGIMESVLRAKLAQHDEIRQALLKSGDAEIAEDSPEDYFWGRGKDGSGQNMLGELWMKLRGELQSS